MKDAFLGSISDLLYIKAKDKKDEISFLPELKGLRPEKVHQTISFSTYEGPALITKDGWKIRYFAAAKNASFSTC